MHPPLRARLYIGRVKIMKTNEKNMETKSKDKDKRHVFYIKPIFYRKNLAKPRKNLGIDTLTVIAARPSYRKQSRVPSPGWVEPKAGAAAGWSSQEIL